MSFGEITSARSNAARASMVFPMLARAMPCRDQTCASLGKSFSVARVRSAAVSNWFVRNAEVMGSMEVCGAWPGSEVRGLCVDCENCEACDQDSDGGAMENAIVMPKTR